MQGNDMNNNNQVPSMSYPGVLALEEFVEITGIPPEHLQELIALGWLSPGTGVAARTVYDDDILRIRRLERICGAFELPIVGGTIIVDLLDRIERLERTVRELNNIVGQVE